MKKRSAIVNLMNKGITQLFASSETWKNLEGTRRKFQERMKTTTNQPCPQRGSLGGANTLNRYGRPAQLLPRQTSTTAGHPTSSPELNCSGKLGEWGENKVFFSGV
ncbi:hypothetical protein Bbelb_238210 [Branchiostoma belcheri]|nr:hypothetical protein Bbelb_238210 [Branchiostoma belcheri]